MLSAKTLLVVRHSTGGDGGGSFQCGNDVEQRGGNSGAGNLASAKNCVTSKSEVACRVYADPETSQTPSLTYTS